MAPLGYVAAPPTTPGYTKFCTRSFYQALGFEISWSDDSLAYVRHGQASFLLQAFNEPLFIANFQMHLLVENVDDWHAQLLGSGIIEQFAVSMGAPEDQPWGMREFILFDPSGVLWRIAQNTPRRDET
ncbi:MAG: VOC family protein [Rhodanobacter sp.]